MASYANEARTAARKSVQLTQRDLDDLAKLRSESPERHALAALSGVNVSGKLSESTVLQTVMRLGMRAIHERLLAEGYEAEAAAITEDELAEQQRVARRPRRLQAMATDE